MRLFLAILPDELFRAALIETQRRMKQQGIRGNYTRPENLHMTLAFLGEYGDPDRVMDAAGTVPFSPFSIRLEGIGAFDRLYWAGTAECGDLNGYVSALRRTLAANEIPFDRKKFRPHITLIRQAVMDRPEPLPAPPRRTMQVRRISLMRSDRGKNGMIYKEIGSIP